MKLILARGLPGSGKSSLAKSLIDGNDLHFEADQYFVNSAGEYVYDHARIAVAHTWCQQITDIRLNDRCNVIISNTFTTMRELRPYFEIAFKYGILPTVILCQNQFQNIHNVPQEALDRMKNRFCYDISPLITEYTEKLNNRLELTCGH